MYWDSFAHHCFLSTSALSKSLCWEASVRVLYWELTLVDWIAAYLQISCFYHNKRMLFWLEIGKVLFLVICRCYFTTFSFPYVAWSSPAHMRSFFLCRQLVLCLCTPNTGLVLSRLFQSFFNPEKFSSIIFSVVPSPQFALSPSFYFFCLGVNYFLFAIHTLSHLWCSGEAASVSTKIMEATSTMCRN